MVHALLFWTSLKDAGERDKKARGDTNRYSQIPSEEEIIQEYLVAARLLLPTSKLLLPSTVFI